MISNDYELSLVSSNKRVLEWFATTGQQVFLKIDYSTGVTID